jgi:hypothetical protein
MGGATSGVKAQMFQNRNLYDVWITAESYLNAGKFEQAITLYEGASNVPQFQRRLKTAKSMQALFGNAERLYRLKKYDQALEMFSKYHELDRDLRVAVFDSRIESCLRQLDKVLVKKLNESTRVVAGFEWAYKGDRQLALLDTVAAGRSYAKAAQLGGNLNATLREQYKEGQKAVENLRNWGQEYRQALATNDNARALELLRSYRTVSKFIINTLEYEIKSREEKYAQNGAAMGPTKQLQAYALDCRIDDLFYFIKNNPRAMASADTATRLLGEYLQINGDIAQLKKDPGNRIFLESAYRSLISKASQIPGVGREVESCARRSFYEYLINLALINEKAGDETGENGKYQEAIGFVVEARQLGLQEFQDDLEEIQGRLAGKTGCEGTIRQFTRSAISIRREISNCRIQQGKKIWDEALSKLSGCNLNTPAFLEKYASLRDSVNRLYEADSLYSLLEGRAARAIAGNRCEEAGRYYGQMAGLPLCNVAYRDSAAISNQRRLAECERISCYNTNREQAIASVNSKDWERAYVSYERAYECATPAQKERISQILATIECDAYPERCRRNIVSVEPTLRVLANKPRYTQDGADRPTAYGYFTSAGLQVSFLSGSNPLDLVVGAEYFRTQYQSLRVDGGAEYKASEFDISGADAYVALKLHKPRTDPDRLRPYLKVGAEVLLPLLYSEINHEDIYKSTNDRSLIKKQLLMASGAIGFEVERKRFGFFAEATTAYNFSGIYNTNAVNSSGARGTTEAYFRAIGVRMGIRFW